MQALDIKLIVIYGVPRCLPDAAQHNDHLLSWAYQRASISCVPTIIGGDFNTLPQDLPAWESFANRGWVELGEFATSAHGLELPCTCKGATRFDTFLLPPSLLQFFHGADVLEDCHLFDSHSPMRLHLRVPGAVVPRWIWPCPKDFTTIVRDCAQLEQNYLVQSASVRTAFSDSVPEAKDGDKIRLWAHTIEEAVHSTIRDQHLSSPQQQEYRGLPKAFRGRCKEADRKKACPPRLPRMARHGDPEPYDEDTTVLGRQRVRQLRRLVTFQQGLVKHFAGKFRGPYAPDGWPASLHKEWQAIVRAAGYGPSFSSWVLQWPCFPWWPAGFPDLAFLDDLVGFVRFDVQAVNRQHAKVKSNLFRYKLQIDATQYGCAQTFATVRPPSKPPFQCVQLTSAQEAVTVDVHSHQLRCFRVPDPSKYDLLSQVSFMNVPGQVTQKRADTVTVLFPQDDDVVLPLCGQLLRHRQDCTWQGIMGSLMEYWHPIWMRDSRSEEADIAHWPQFSSMLHRLTSPCPTLEVDMLDATAWAHVARRLSPHKSRGICGWSNAELRVLPLPALRDLALVMHRPGQACLPSDLLRCRVAVLSKVESPVCASQARPITIFGCLYRLWTRVLCTQVLKIWSFTLPPGVAGCLKQRSVVDLSYCVQAEIEDSLCCQSDLSGLSLDLRKAFNFLPRCPIVATLHFLGVPGELCATWQACLSKVQRHFEVLGSLGPGLPSTTGAPEGDPISVLAMLGICFVLVASLHNLVQARTYMDNWTWTADLPDCHGPALLILMDLTSSLRLEIDWNKTYVWGTEKPSQTWWRDIGPAFLPTGVDLPVIQHVKELGAFLQFSRKPHRKGFASRVEDAQARLHKLARTPQSGYARARVLQSGIWPFLFFGSEGLSPALTTMQQIRGSAARAVAGNHHTISPFAALYLCPHAQDPEVYVLCHHLRQFRRMGDLFPRLAQTVWQRVTGPHIGQRSVCGPAGALQNLLRRNQWVPESDGWCKGPLNCAFHVFRSSPQQLTRAVELAWADTVQDNIQHRVGLQAAPPPNARVCHKVLQGFRSWEQKILLRHFAGGYLSGAEKHSWSRGDYEACPLCGLRDTKAHRIFDCPVLQPARQDHTCVLQQVRHEQPHWTHMTFASLPPQADMLHLMLQGLRLPPLAPPAPPGRRLCLFTDGSGRHSQVPLARLVTWAVVLADPAACTAIAQREPGAQERGFTVLATGCVPGEQTVPRAEICALIWASTWANQSGGPTEIFVDCQPAIDIWEQWHREGFAAVRRKAAADLFRDVQPQGPCSVYKVKAHQTWQEWLAASERDRWIACGNEAADAAAKSAYDQLPEFLRTTADEVASHCLSQQKLLRKFCHALLAVGLQDIKLRAAIPTAAPAVSTSSGEQLDGFIQTFGSWQPPLCACQLPDHLEENWDGWVFGAAFGRKLLDWLRWVQWPEQPVAPEFAGSISYLELLSHFTMMTGSPPPTVRTTGTKQEYLPLCQALDDLLPCPTCSLVTVFRAALKQLGQRYNFTVIPAVDVKNVAHLQWFGVAAPSPGVDLRPYLPGQWLADFRWICEGDVAHRLGSFCRA